MNGLQFGTVAIIRQSSNNCNSTILMIKSITGKNRRPSETLNRTFTPESNNRALHDFSYQVEKTVLVCNYL